MVQIWLILFEYANIICAVWQFNSYINSNTDKLIVTTVLIRLGDFSMDYNRLQSDMDCYSYCKELISPEIMASAIFL